MMLSETDSIKKNNHRKEVYPKIGPPIDLHVTI